MVKMFLPLLLCYWLSARQTYSADSYAACQRLAIVGWVASSSPGCPSRYWSLPGWLPAPAQLFGVDIARQSALVAVEEIICLTFKIWMVFNQPLKLKLLTSLCQYKEWFLGAIPCKCGDDGDWGEHRKGMG